MGKEPLSEMFHGDTLTANDLPPAGIVCTILRFEDRDLTSPFDNKVKRKPLMYLSGLKWPAVMGVENYARLGINAKTDKRAGDAIHAMLIGRSVRLSPYHRNGARNQDGSPKMCIKMELVAAPAQPKTQEGAKTNG